MLAACIVFLLVILAFAFLAPSVLYGLGLVTVAALFVLIVWDCVALAETTERGDGR